MAGCRCGISGKNSCLQASGRGQRGETPRGLPAVFGAPREVLQALPCSWGFSSSPSLVLAQSGSPYSLTQPGRHLEEPGPAGLSPEAVLGERARGGGPWGHPTCSFRVGSMGSNLKQTELQSRRSEFGPRGRPVAPGCPAFPPALGAWGKVSALCVSQAGRVDGGEAGSWGDVGRVCRAGLG